jgi:hypothetical protein
MKLADIDSIDLAREVVARAADRLHSAAMAIDMRLDVEVRREGEPWSPHARADGTPWPRPEGGVGVWGAPASTTLGQAVRALVLYARDGGTLDAPVHDYAVTLVGAADDALDDAGAPDPSTPLGLVVAAALGREAVDAGKPVPTAHLAALAGVTDGRVRQLVASGELGSVTRGGNNFVRARDARRWLGLRRTPGFIQLLS